LLRETRTNSARTLTN